MPLLSAPKMRKRFSFNFVTSPSFKPSEKSARHDPKALHFISNKRKWLLQFRLNNLISIFFHVSMNHTHQIKYWCSCMNAIGFSGLHFHAPWLIIENEWKPLFVIDTNLWLIIEIALDIEDDQWCAEIVYHYGAIRNDDHNLEKRLWWIYNVPDCFSWFLEGLISWMCFADSSLFGQNFSGESGLENRIYDENNVNQQCSMKIRQLWTLTSKPRRGETLLADKEFELSQSWSIRIAGAILVCWAI
jgi:hypothetical protein